MPSRLLAAKQLAELFKALAHPDRIRLVEELRQEELDVHTLAERLDLPDPRVSQHLAVLRAHMIVEERKEGRHVYYHLSDDALSDWVLDGLRFLEGRLSRDMSQLAAAHEAHAMWTNEETTTDGFNSNH